MRYAVNPLQTSQRLHNICPSVCGPDGSFQFLFVDIEVFESLQYRFKYVDTYKIMLFIIWLYMI